MVGVLYRGVFSHVDFGDFSIHSIKHLFFLLQSGSDSILSVAFSLQGTTSPLKESLSLRGWCFCPELPWVCLASATSVGRSTGHFDGQESLGNEGSC